MAKIPFADEKKDIVDLACSATLLIEVSNLFIIQQAVIKL
jgi:hypothetical protein